MSVHTLVGGILFIVRMSDMDVVNAENAGVQSVKEKYPKETTPGCRLLPELRRFYRGSLEGISYPCRTPSGYSQ
jgi:hypothetical protein